MIILLALVSALKCTTVGANQLVIYFVCIFTEFGKFFRNFQEKVENLPRVGVLVANELFSQNSVGSFIH